MQELRESRRRLADLINEAAQLELLEDRRDLHPHEWNRLCGLYVEITALEQLLAHYGRRHG